ncbi:hypothetical protein [Mucilaginibacter sp. SP1R1]|uniref:hypothetical protein n=1 Tax=Mucilaginibacter sp. SP1R1 TaxID=2723091 RepID=UPI00161297F6|nr:hypothetical protein [Mucilaginibacter sp. SP1R1]
MGSNHDRLNQNQKCYHYTTGKYWIVIFTTTGQIYYLRVYNATNSVSDVSYIYLLTNLPSSNTTSKSSASQDNNNDNYS